MAVKKRSGHLREIAIVDGQLSATCEVEACTWAYTGPQGRAGVHRMNNDWNAHVVSVLYPEGL